MNLLKKCASNNRLCTSRNTGRRSSRPVGQAGEANSSEVKPDATRSGRLTFVEDFTREHSLSGPHIASIEISSNF
jgi:hypothetical protein